jgi:hypothetical protein
VINKLFSKVEDPKSEEDLIIDDSNNTNVVISEKKLLDHEEINLELEEMDSSKSENITDEISEQINIQKTESNLEDDFTFQLDNSDLDNNSNIIEKLDIKKSDNKNIVESNA